MKKRIREILIFLGGLILGLAFYYFLSSQAVSTYTDYLRIKYLLEQQAMAIEAKNKNNIKEAIIHYQNIVDAYSSVLNCFENSKKIWTFSYPIIASINKYLGISQIERSGASEGIYRALLSNALERDGNIIEANMELEKASVLLGCGKDIERTKEILKSILKSEVNFCSSSGVGTP